ncbi:type I-E CRISPR-associated protein Cas5/CasD [Bifidobacterium sp. ESL0784]|uniref:type I-E CRISPR-associated protein Cas5/CasD n=1 Tax=Bifidobacterium sp. ESL0784 TaxID=2983231 RepID=UPI0023F9A069|nr:type I-E CRISPR-associated protein Cas5/CasD [Bifidobacterium sp. ESL0784]MDF7641705.1 type I-E CRISPR-associated protein Cas5/CasD [Bifidobacterium sp. ESL0784]
MSVLLLSLSAPMQSWGDSSRFVRRNTNNEPTKSGVLGLLASAQGRSREDPIEDLAGLEFGVRVEQPGRVIRDFQTERPVEGKPMPLTNRYYLADARFLVALGGTRDFLVTLDVTLRNPKWPLYLGRRACPADFPVTLGVHDEYDDVRQALAQEPWRASDYYKSRHNLPQLEVACDAHPGENTENQDDLPLSFSIKHRQYAGRAVYHFSVPNPDCPDVDIANDAGAMRFADDHDPMNF